MDYERYNQLESLYLKLGTVIGCGDPIAQMAKYIVDRDDYVSSPLTNDTNDYDYLKATMRFWTLTQMDMETQGNFKYEDDLYKAKNAVISWINKVFKKGYDKYLMAQILLGENCVYYWNSSFKKEFKFIFKKASDIDTMTRWIQRFIELSEKKGYFNFSTFFAENAIREFSNHNVLTNETKSMLKSHMR